MHAEQAQPAPREAARETIESIVIALILAFVFRAFIVEAFSIPTGSMAPTLYGAHGTILCQDCGTEFAYGLRDLKEQRSIGRITANHSAFCPNCNYRNTNLTINDVRGNPEPGDRILVLKWPYDLGVDALGPRRWDVTVFKDPSDGVTNFIKRLVGLPNEVLMIIDGDVFVAPVASLADNVVAELEALREEKYALRTGQLRGRLRATPQFVLDELDRKSHIARKTETAQKPLWLPFYDHDRMPQHPTADRPAWRPAKGGASGWDATTRRVTFDDTGVDEEDMLLLTGPVPRATCAYNIDDNLNSPRPRDARSASPPFVHDLRVRFVLTPESAEGSVTVHLMKNGRVFEGRVAFDGTVSIIERDPARGTRPVHVDGKRAPLRPGVPIEVSFENCDYRLVLRVDGEPAIASSDDADSTGYYAPDLGALRNARPHPSRPSISGRGKFELAHLAVQRDVYYFLKHASNSLRLVWAADSWGGPRTPIMLRGHEYFMLGDNTAASKDSRLWDELSPYLQARGESCQLGTVPRDQIIGRAFFVYWPSMQRVDWLDWLPRFSRWGIVPDVGRMRWIR